MSVMGLIFFYLWKTGKKFDERIYAVLFWLHFLYFIAGAYRMFGEWFFPNALAATYTFYQTIGNGIYIVTLTFLGGGALWRIWKGQPALRNGVRALFRRNEYKTPPSAKIDDYPRGAPRWFINFLIEVSNSERPENEHLPLIESEEKNQPPKALRRQPISDEGKD